MRPWKYKPFLKNGFFLLSFSTFLIFSESSLKAKDRLGEEEGTDGISSGSINVSSKKNQSPWNFSSFVDRYIPSLIMRAQEEKTSSQARLTLALIYANGYDKKTHYSYGVARMLYQDILKKDPQNAEALYYLGNLSWNLNENPVPYWERAASLGYPKALCAMGMRPYYADVPAEGTEKKRLDYLAQAAEKGDRDAMFEAGRIYFQRPNRNEEDLQKALEYFHLAAAEKDPRAQHILSQLYRKGEGVERDLEKAERLLHEAQTTTADASYYLKQGWQAEEEGRGEEAARLYAKAAELGNDQALICKNLLELFYNIRVDVPAYTKPPITWRPSVSISSSPIGFLGGLMQRVVRLLPK